MNTENKDQGAKAVLLRLLRSVFICVHLWFQHFLSALICGHIYKELLRVDPRFRIHKQFLDMHLKNFGPFMLIHGIKILVLISSKNWSCSHRASDDDRG